MTEILLRNLNFIELSTILQLITILDSSDGNNIKPQAIQTLFKYKKVGFYTTLDGSAHNFGYVTSGRRRLGAAVWAPPFGREDIWAPAVWAPAVWAPS